MKKLLFSIFFFVPFITFSQAYSGKQLEKFKQQAAGITIIRDNWGVPHIYGKTDADAVFGLMYSECDDNFKGIERNYLYQLGRQAGRQEETRDFYGNSAEKSASVYRPGTSEKETGSNGFAIAPARSHALLYINPHVPFYFRSEVQLVSGEGLNVYGAVTWGQFFVYQGFNAHCGWMHTSSNADVGDLYAEKVTKKDGKWFYEYNGISKPVNARKLTLYVKSGGSLKKKIITG